MYAIMAWTLLLLGSSSVVPELMADTFTEFTAKTIIWAFVTAATTFGVFVYWRDFLGAVKKT